MDPKSQVTISVFFFMLFPLIVFFAFGRTNSLGVAKGQSLKKVEPIPKTENELYELAKSTNSIYYWENLLRDYPEGKYTSEARQAIIAKLPQEEPLHSFAYMLASLEDIDGASFDPEDGQLRIWGEKSSGRLPPLLLDDLIVAIRVNALNERLGVSIEPSEGLKGHERSGTEQPLESAVLYFPPMIKNTHVGSLLFEADRKLKCLSIGIDNLKGENIFCTVSGFRTLVQRAIDSHYIGWGEGYFGRLWFEPPKPDVRIEGYCAKIGKVNMVVEPESPYFLVREFATHMNDFFKEFAQREMVFTELVRLYKINALARWLLDSGFPIEEIVKKYSVWEVKTPEKTLARFVPIKLFEWEDAFYRYERKLGVAGGVAFPIGNNYVRPIDSNTRTDIFLSKNGPMRYGSIPPEKALSIEAREIKKQKPTSNSMSWTAILSGNKYYVVSITLHP